MDETEDEANNIIKNKKRRQNGNLKLKFRQKNLDNDQPLCDDSQFFENTQDADQRSLSQIGCSGTMRAKKCR
jgi:hypothetical protein